MFFNVEDYEKNAFLQKRIAEVLVALSRPPRKSEFILDIGSGTGFVGRLLPKKRGLITHGVDISEKMISFAKPYYSNVFQMDARFLELPFKYDMILSSMCLQWIENQNNAIFKIISHLKKWGKFYFAVPLESSYAEVNAAFEKEGLKSPLLKLINPSIQPIHVEEYIEYFPSLISFLKSFNKAGIKNEFAQRLTAKQLKDASLNFKGEVRWEIGFFACFSR